MWTERRIKTGDTHSNQGPLEGHKNPNDMGKIWRLLRGKIASDEQGYCRHKLTHSSSHYCTKNLTVS